MRFRLFRLPLWGENLFPATGDIFTVATGIGTRLYVVAEQAQTIGIIQSRVIF